MRNPTNRSTRHPRKRGDAGPREDVTETARDAADLWRWATRDAKPFPGRRANVPDATRSDRERGERKRPELPRKMAPVDPAAEPDLDVVEVRRGRAPGIDRRTAERMRRGQLAIEARVDLHGMTRAEARNVLDEFLARAWSDGRRSVLIITGKGQRSERGAGVLRDAVPQWLREGPNRTRVLGLSPAQPKDGGEGAFYVLLRRRRSGGAKSR